VSAGPDIAAVLVVDIVGSTSLRQQIGEPRWAKLRRDFMTAGRRIVGKHRGLLVKEQGDGFLASFDTASAALAASIELLQATATANRRHPDAEHLDLRLGASAGETEWDGSDVTGLVSVEAARLEAAAPPNTILCADVVRVLAGDDGPFSFVDAGALTLKGLREPVHAWNVAWKETRTGQQLGVPEPLQPEQRLRFVGRGDELARLATSWAAVSEGRGRLVAVTGEPGVGKTRLCAEFAGTSLDGGGIILYGRCDPVVAYPYQPFVEALRRYTRQAAQLELLSASDAAELARLVPEIHDQLPDLGEPVVADSDTQRYLLFEAMVEWLQFLAHEDPVMLILDDLTWATVPTLAMLHHIASRLGEAAVMCIVTYRPQEAPDGLHDIVAGVRRRVPCDSIPLDGLDQDEVLLALRGLLGDDALDPEVAALGSAVWRESGGNPFYVSELFASMLDSGSIHLGKRGWTTTVNPGGIAIPTVLGDVVLQRHRALAAPTQSVLSAASVAGVSFDAGIVRDVVALPQAVFSTSLDEAEDAGLARCTGGEHYDFSHALVREVLYENHSSGQRALLHEKVARAIEAASPGRLEEHADDLALHYSLAPTADGAARGVWHAAVAAGRASERFAYAEAVGQYERALGSLERARQPDYERIRCGLVVDLGVAQHRAGDSRALATLLEGSKLAAAAGEGLLCARAVLAGSRGMFSSTGAIDEQRVGALRTALDLVGDADSLIRARLLANLSVELGFTGDHNEQDRLSDEATAMARRLADPGALVPVLALRLVTLWRVDRVAERLELALELEQLCEAYGRPQAILLAATMGCQAAMEAGDFATADRRLARIDHITAELRQPLSLGYARLRQSLRASVDGRLDESERLADEAYEYTRASGQPDAAAFWVGQRFNIRFHQGRLGEIVEELAEAADEHRGIVAFRAAVALVAAELHQPDPARHALDAIFGPEGTGIPDDLNWLTSAAFATQAAAQLGDPALCDTLYEMLIPYRDQFVDNATTFWGSVERYIALAASCTGRHDEARASFERAVDAHSRLNAPILLARTRLEFAETTLIADMSSASRSFAVDHFRAALSTAERLELRTIARRAREGLAELGG
jgi:class 3 adenylate cyclase